MKIVERSVTLLKCKNYKDINSILKFIEMCGRTAYKSVDKMTDDSYKRFTDMLNSNGHRSVFEHGTIYLYISSDNTPEASKIAKKYKNNHYSVVYYTCKDNVDAYYITTNYRVIVENHFEDDLKYLCEPTSFHEKRYTFRIITGIDISREGNRHRVNSITEESTRYCNYSKDKFDNQISIIENSDISKEDIDKYLESYNAEELESLNDPIAVFICANQIAELCYLKLIELGWKPQQARRVLPLDTKTEVIYTATKHEWLHFISLRSANDAHPDIKYISDKIKEYIENDEN